MYQTAIGTIEKFHMLQKGDSIIVGLSGGADSSALLHFLCSLRQQYTLQLTAIHIHHGLRGKEADRDADFVKEICSKWNVACKIFYYDVKKEAACRKIGEEEAGRMIRYAEFQKAAKECNGKIAIAHTRNDQAETMIMRLARGTGLKGLAGIAPVYGTIIRPLIECGREQIEEYCSNFKIDYCTDSTNEIDLYTRNKIRHFILPWLEKELNPNAVKNMANTAMLLLEEEQYLQELTQKEWNTLLIKKTEKELILDKEKLKKIPLVLQRRILKTAFAFIAKNSKEFYGFHIEAVMKLLQKQTGKKLSLPLGVYAEIEYKKLRFFLDKKNITKEYVYNLALGETIFIKEIGKYVELSLNEEKKSVKESNICTKVFDYDKIKSDISLRTRKQGDFIFLKGISGSKKLKDYFIDAKIPREQRDCVPLICFGSHVLWIVGRRSSDACLVDNDTKNILYIQIWEEV